MAGLAAMLKPPSLDQQLDQLRGFMERVAASVEHLEEIAQTETDRVENNVVDLYLNSVDRPIWNDGRQLHIVKLLVSTDTAGRFAFQIGSDTSRLFRVPANQVVQVITGRESPIVIPNGVSFTITPTAGNPAWEAMIWAIPGRVPGSQDVPQ